MKKINTLIVLIFLLVSLIFLSCSVSVKENLLEKPKSLDKETTISQQNENELSIMLAEIEEIVDPNNISWPRIVNINDIEIVIYDKPKRIVTVSLGHDEILFGIAIKEDERVPKLFLLSTKHIASSGLFCLLILSVANKSSQDNQSLLSGLGIGA